MATTAGYGRQVSVGPSAANNMAQDRSRITYGANLLLYQGQLSTVVGQIVWGPTQQTVLLKSFRARNITNGTVQYWMRLIPGGGTNDTTNEFHSVILGAYQEDPVACEEVLLAGYQICLYASAANSVNIRLNALSSASQ